jgi:signal peptidase I
MTPTIRDGVILVILSAGSTPSRGDIVIIRSPYAESKPACWCKRVVAIPGDRLELIGGTGVVRVNGEVLRESYLDDVTPRPRYDLYQTWTLGKSEYFVMGDNREVSLDSRIVGPIQEADILVVVDEWFAF